MLGDFTYENPCRLHFGPNALDELSGELAKFGPKVLLTYGGGSIKRSGLYQKVIATLEAAGKTVVEVPGVMSNPTADKLREGAKVARENDVDLILAVGGGSTIDYAKGVSVSAWTEGDPWEHLYLNMEQPTGKIIPVGDILTMSGTGSEMNAGSVITNHEEGLKIGHVFGSDVMPKFAIVNPELTFTVPDYQMRAGIFDAFNHIQEQYFSGTDDNTSDYIAEGLMRSLLGVHVGAQHAHRVRQVYGLGGPHAGPGHRRRHGRHARHDAFGRGAAVLPPGHAVWREEVRALRHERVRRPRGRQDGRAARRGRPRRHERLDGPDRRRAPRQRARPHKGEHPRRGQGHDYPGRRLPQAHDRRASRPASPAPRERDGHAHGQKDGETREGEPVRA